MLEVNVLFRQMQEQSNALQALLDRLDDVTRRRTRDALGAFFRQLASNIEG